MRARLGAIQSGVCVTAGLLIAAGSYGCDGPFAGNQPADTSRTSPGAEAVSEGAAAPERVAYDDWVAPLNGYPHRFSADVGGPVVIHYASERGDAHPVLGGYAIHDLVDDAIVHRVSFENDGPSVSLHPCASWYGDGCEYPGTLALDTAALPVGTYYVILRDFLGHESHKIYFNLRPPATAPDLPRVVLLYPTFTYAAYSRIGGGSLYGPPLAADRWEASLQRPIPYVGPALEAFNSPESMGCFASRLRALGIPYLPLSSLDVHTHPEYLRDAALVLIGSHDEYWSRPIADAVDAVLDRGGSVMILGGGTRAWQVEVLPTAIRLNRQADPPAETALVSGRFSSPAINRPAAERFGLSSDTPARPFPGHLTVDQALERGLSCDMLEQLRGVTIADETHPIFADTGLRTGDLYGAALGVFWRSADGVPLLPDGSVDYAAAPRTPPDLHVLAYVPRYRRHAENEETDPGRAGVVAETRTAAGGRVLAFGSYGWFRSVCSGDPTGVRIFDNSIRYLLNSP